MLRFPPVAVAFLRLLGPEMVITWIDEQRGLFLVHPPHQQPPPVLPRWGVSDVT